MISCGYSQNLGLCHPLELGVGSKSSVTGYSGSSPLQYIILYLSLTTEDEELEVA